MKRRIALILGLILLMGSLSAYAEGQAERLIPQVFVERFAQALKQLFERPEDAARYRLQEAESEGNILRWESEEDHVTLRCAYPDAAPDAAEAAGTLELSLRDVPQADLPLLEQAFAEALQEDQIAAWMTNAAQGMSMQQLEGCTLLLSKSGGDRTFTLLASSGAPVSEPEPEPSQAPTATEGAILSWEGFEAIPISYEIRQREESASLKLNMRVINDTDRTFWLKVQNCEIDGVPVEGFGITDIDPRSDTGVDTKEYCLFRAERQEAPAAADAIGRAQVVRMTLVVRDKEQLRDVWHEPVELDLSTLPGTVTTPMPTTAAPQTPSPTATPRPTSAYRTLKKGDSGEDVRKLQQRLIDLDYLNDKADGKFGSKTGAAVQLFSEQNGLPATQTASPEMQEVLFSAYARAYSEPAMPITLGPEAEWRGGFGEQRLLFRIQVTNNSRSRSIRGYELRIYTTDVWGNKNTTDTLNYTVVKNVGPGKTVYSDWLELPYDVSASIAWVALVRVSFSDGEVRYGDSTDFQGFQFT